MLHIHQLKRPNIIARLICIAKDAAKKRGVLGLESEKFTHC